MAILAWWFPIEHDRADHAGPASTGVDIGQPTTPGATSPGSAASPGSGAGAGPGAPVRYLNTITPEEGGRYLTRLPAELAGRSEYAHAVTIACPSNQTGDQVRSVTYPLNQRYLNFSGTVTAHFRPTVSVPDPRVELTSVASELQRDGTLRDSANETRRATADQPSPMSLTVTGAEKLEVRVTCEIPDGAVILVDARLTPAQ